MFLKKIVFAALAAMSLNVYATGTEYIVNGTFDNYSSDNINAVGWTVTADNGYFSADGNVYFQYYDGVYHEGSPSATGETLSQVITGAKGAMVLSFDLSANTAGTGFETTLWNGKTQMSVVTNDGLALTHYAFNVLATGNDTLEFIGQNNTDYNMLSNVSLRAVTAVPEPETWGMLLAGLGLVGGIARRKAAQRAA